MHNKSNQGWPLNILLEKALQQINVCPSAVTARCCKHLSRNIILQTCIWQQGKRRRVKNFVCCACDTQLACRALEAGCWRCCKICGEQPTEHHCHLLCALLGRVQVLKHCRHTAICRCVLLDTQVLISIACHLRHQDQQIQSAGPWPSSGCVTFKQRTIKNTCCKATYQHTHGRHLHSQRMSRHLQDTCPGPFLCHKCKSQALPCPTVSPEEDV